MIIIFNLIGAGILILAIGAGAGVACLFGPRPEVLVTGLVALVLDMMYRMKRGQGSMFHPRRGGHVFFIPAWVIGVGMFLMGCLCLVLPDNGSTLSAEHSQRLLPQGPPARSSLSAGNQKGPTQPQAEELKLTMITGTGQRGLATINGQIFAPGETHNVEVAQHDVSLTCIEIRQQSAIVKLAEESSPFTLKFGEPVSLEAMR